MPSNAGPSLPRAYSCKATGRQWHNGEYGLARPLFLMFQATRAHHAGPLCGAGSHASSAEIRLGVSCATVRDFSHTGFEGVASERRA